MKYVVMSGIEITGPNSNRDRCYDSNFVTDHEPTAREEVVRRNEAETAACHDNVTWFMMEWPC